MNRLYAGAGRLERSVVHRLAPYHGALLRISIGLLRISLGLVFLVFGALKFVPGLSPAEGIATRTVDTLTLGLMPDGLALAFVAALETAIGLSLLTGRRLRLGLVLLGVAMVGILAPLVLFPGQLFSRPGHAPTLEAQYVFKDIVLLAAALVVAVGTLARHPAAAAARAPADDSEGGRPVRPIGQRTANRRLNAAA